MSEKKNEVAGLIQLIIGPMFAGKTTGKYYN